MVAEQGCERLCKDLRHRASLRAKGGEPGMSSKSPFWEPRVGEAAAGPCSKHDPSLPMRPNPGEAEGKGDRLLGLHCG